MYDNIERILIVRTDRIGDVILTLPMAAVLKRHFPHAGISMLIRRYTSDLVKNSPHVEHVITIDEGERLIPISRLVGAVRAGKFDVVFHTHPRFRIALLTFLAGIPLRIGTGYRWYSFLFNRKVYEHRKDARFHELEYNLHLMRAIGIDAGTGDAAPAIEVSPETSERVGSFLRDRGVKEGEPVIVLHPGSHGSAKNWSPGKFGELARLLAALPGVRLVITGGPGEEAIAHEVFVNAGSRALELVGTFSLIEYAALARRASLFVANSTGTLHIAAAVGTPVIGFYPQHASLSAKRWGPYAKRRALFTPVNQPPDCRKCAGRPTQPCACMETIGVDEVYRAALALLGEGAAVPGIPPVTVEGGHA